MKRKVKLTVEIDVEVDEAKFTPDFMKEYRETIDSGFFEIEDHIMQLAYVGVRDEPWCNQFVEGYGPLNEMGIKLSEPSFEQIEIVRDEQAERVD